MLESEYGRHQAGAEIERRARERHQFHYSSRVAFLVRPSGPLAEGVVRDISAEGLALLVKIYLEPGTVLQVELPALDGSVRRQAMKVIHATPYIRGGWIIGCKLTPPLSDPTLTRVLQYSPEDA